MVIKLKSILTIYIDLLTCLQPNSYFIIIILLKGWSRSQLRFKACLSCFVHHWSLCNKTGYIDELLLITRPSASQLGMYWHNAVTYCITKHITGGILLERDEHIISCFLLCLQEQEASQCMGGHNLPRDEAGHHLLLTVHTGSGGIPQSQCSF